MRVKSIAILVSLSLVAAPVAEARAQQPISDAARAAWGFAGSVAPHPEVRFGVLANGMRYALMRSDRPSGGLSVRMRVDVGAAMEGEREQGFAHLVEHMIFHGSEKIPEGALPMMLSQQGLKRWTDFSAYTSYDETVFKLDLGSASGSARATALVLMREIASGLQFGRAAVEGAKKKVVEEIRGRDDVGDRIMTAQNGFYAPGTPIARGPVAGTVASVRRVEAGALQRFYQRHYAPRAVTLVVVGDIDPAVVEREIGLQFEKWQSASAQALSRSVSSHKAIGGTQARLFVDPAAPTRVTIASATDLAAAGDTAPRRDAYFLERMGSEMLSRRLGRAGSKAGASFATGTAATYDHFATVRLASIDLEARGGDWRAALTQGATELRRALRDGFSQAELDDQLASSRAALAQSPRPQTASAIADALIDAVGRGIVFTAPADRSALNDYLARVKLADVNAAFRAAWARGGRLIFVSHNRRIAGGEGAIVKAWEACSAAATCP